MDSSVSNNHKAKEFFEYLIKIYFLCQTEIKSIKITGSRVVDGKRFLKSNASSILGTLT